MRYIYLAIAVLSLVGCQRQSPNQSVKATSLPSTSTTESTIATEFDFGDLHERIDKMNKSPMPYFKTNWPKLLDDLNMYLETGQLTSLPVEQQEVICMDLEYLRGCYHGDVMREHGEEIHAITSRLELTPETRQLLDAMQPASQ